MAEVERLMPSLRDYPLYPYLEYRELTQDMSLLTAGQVKILRIPIRTCRQRQV